jgi:hypothetical protein
MPITLPIKKMTRKEKLIAMEELWTDLSRDDSRIVSPSWHADELRKAERLVGEGKAKFSDWEEAKVRIRRKAAKIS